MLYFIYYIQFFIYIVIVYSFQRHGQRMKCSACKIMAHASCISVLMDRTQLACKPTFRDVGVRQYREQTTTHHHWVHRRSEKGKCKQCGKVSFLLFLFIFSIFIIFIEFTFYFSVVYIYLLFNFKITS